MTETVTEIDRDQIASDFREMQAGKLPQEVIDNAIAYLARAPKDAVISSYPANGAVASLILYTKCQCTIEGGKTFDGAAWGITFPGGGALKGAVFTDDINKLYASTREFALVATPVYTSFIFYGEGSTHPLGHFEAGAISTVAGTGFGGGEWS